MATPGTNLPTTPSESRLQTIKALAHPSRLLIIESLHDGEKCVCDLRDLTGSDLSTVSKHLAILRSAGLVASQKRGLRVFYRLRCDCLVPFLNCLDQLARPSRQKRALLGENTK
ncbi:MAG: ArsR/SmtB family transcription factor [Verrucomicrobiota bacterium]|jgi:DNA-binding transcriptional ArsR family regulator